MRDEKISEKREKLKNLWDYPEGILALLEQEKKTIDELGIEKQ
jgi:hypothetical protein